MATSSAVNILNYGAVGNGIKDDSLAFSKAWSDTCNSVANQSTLLVPSGHTFLVQPLTFTGPCKSPNLYFQLEGGVVAPGGPEKWKIKAQSLISFENVSGLTLDGYGTINGLGKGWWDLSCANHPKLKGCYDRRPTTLTFIYCTRIRVNNIFMINSPQVHILVWYSNDVKFDSVSINSPALSPNTDGIHIEDSKNVSVFHSVIKAGDDCISIGDQSFHILIVNIFCGPGHGISIGSLGRDGEEVKVENIQVHRANFFGTTNGVRIKTYQVMYTLKFINMNLVGKGIVQHVGFKNLTFHNVENPIIIDQHYCFDPNGCPDLPTAVHIDDVKFQGAIGTSASEVAMNLNCSKSVPCTNINFKNIRLKPAKSLKRIKSSCNNAYGSNTGTVKPSSCLHS
ncbi:hypothetical protein CsatA_021865 [Cannabis sativa]